MRHHCRRAGFTQLELLTAITVIALLAALLLPAVQRVRESSRLAQCRDHVRAFGVALQNFESVDRRLPPAIPATEIRPDGTAYSRHNYSPHVMLLPYLDLTNVYNQFDLSQPQSMVKTISALPDAAMHPIAALRCPSDSSVDFSTNYRFCTGDQAHAIRGGGGFSEMRGIPLAAVRDGLSMTAAVSERVVSDRSHNQFHRRQDFWVSGASRLPGFDPFDVDEMVRICESLSVAPSIYMSRVGHQWLNASYAYSWYNHATTPNSSVPDCAAGIAQIAPIPDLLNSVIGVHKASSWHQGGVNVLFLDGSVRFVADSVDLSVWRAVGTIGGREAISATSI